MLSLTLNFLVGLLGYLAFGDKLNAVIMLNMNMKNPICFLAVTAFAISLCVAFPL